MLERYYQSANQLCAALSHNNLEAFLLSLQAMLTTTEDVVIWFVSKQGALSTEACLKDLELTSLVVKHHAILLLVRETIKQYETQIPISDITTLLQCQKIEARLTDAQAIFESYCPVDNRTYH